MISVSKIRRGIAALALLLLTALALMKWQGVDQKLMMILILASGLLVGLLLITYRAFAGVVESAASMPQQSPLELDEDET